MDIYDKTGNWFKRVQDPAIIYCPLCGLPETEGEFDAECHCWDTPKEDEPTAPEACLDNPAVAETPTPPTTVPSQWEDLLAGRLAQCHLPGGVLERLIAEAVADILPAMAATLERQLRFRIYREQRAHLQTCDDY